MSEIYQMLVMGTSAIVVIFAWKVVVGKYPNLFPGWRDVVATV